MNTKMATPSFMANPIQKTTLNKVEGMTKEMAKKILEENNINILREDADGLFVINKFHKLKTDCDVDKLFKWIGGIEGGPNDTIDFVHTGVTDLGNCKSIKGHELIFEKCERCSAPSYYDYLYGDGGQYCENYCSGEYFERYGTSIRNLGKLEHYEVLPNKNGEYDESYSYRMMQLLKERGLLPKRVKF